MRKQPHVCRRGDTLAAVAPSIGEKNEVMVGGECGARFMIWHGEGMGGARQWQRRATACVGVVVVFVGSVVCLVAMLR